MLFVSRREVVLAAAGTVAAQAAHAQAKRKPDMTFATLTSAAAAIRDRRISSAELTAEVFGRIERYDSKLNAFVYLLREDAVAAAKRADEAQARGARLGPLHGVPVHIKESFAYAGRPCTWGIPHFKDTKAPADSDVTLRLRNAGAVIVGATNVAANLEDWQSSNPIYGVTNNPWDLARTPGGSSGGSAAALAAGLGFLSVGSDIGGSIRVPAHFCGLFGHKPTIDLVSLTGHLPGGIRTSPGFSTDLAVAGPLARGAADLALALEVLGGAPAGSSNGKAWTWSLPKPRHAALKDFRVGYVLDDPFAPVSSDQKPAFEALLRRLEKSGAKLVPGWPEGYKPEVGLRTYQFLLSAFMYATAPKPAQEEMDKRPADANDIWWAGAHATHVDWMTRNLMRLGFRARWQKHFETVDVFLTPTCIVPAFPHDLKRQVVRTPEGEAPYMDMFNWIAASTLTGCPSTTAPIGHTASGLPVGLQIMGPMWEDATPARFAELVGVFTAPPGWD